MLRSKKCSVPGAADAVPVTAHDSAQLFSPLVSSNAALLAVSGGSDSMALMWLGARWARETGWPGKLHIATVDHGLREEAAVEANWVADEATQLGLEAHVLKWEGPYPRTGIPAAAREARYGLLCELAHQLGAVLVTAHTRDDQAETLLMTLARGSGLDGLSGIRASSVRNGVMLLRPFLGVARERLRSTLRDAGKGWVEDPTNDNPMHERVRVRAALDVLDGLGATRQAIALSASRLSRARAALDVATTGLMQVAVRHADAGYGTVSRTVLEHAPDELRVRLVMELCRIYGGGQGASLSGAEALADWLIMDKSRARTFGGCLFARREKTFIVGREKARVSTGAIEVCAGSAQPVCWDQRYGVWVPEALLPARIIPVSEVVGLVRPDGVPDFVWQALPALLPAQGGAFTPASQSTGTDGPRFRLIQARNIMQAAG